MSTLERLNSFEKWTKKKKISTQVFLLSALRMNTTCIQIVDLVDQILRRVVQQALGLLRILLQE